MPACQRERRAGSDGAGAGGFIINYHVTLIKSPQGTAAAGAWDGLHSCLEGKMISHIMKGNIHPVAALSKHLQGWGISFSQGSLFLEQGSWLCGLGQGCWGRRLDQLTSNLPAVVGGLTDLRARAPPPSSRWSEIPSSAS